MAVRFKWREVDVLDESTGEVNLQFAMVPVPSHHNLARHQFGDGGEFTLESVSEQQIDKARGHVPYIITMQEYFDNLPETMSHKWPSATHFRRWCLIECGYFEQREVACVSAKAAQATALFMRELDEYARIAVNQSIIVVRRAKSQSPRKTKMDKDELKASRKAVEDLASSFVNVPRSEMHRHAGRHA